MVRSPRKTKSDTFYFVDNKLFMHNKAEYSYFWAGRLFKKTSILEPVI